MKLMNHTPGLIVALSRDTEADLAAGLTVAQVCQKLSVSENTYHRWKKLYGGMKASDAKQLRLLQEENRRLKKAVADLTLEKQILKEVAEGNF